MIKYQRCDYEEKHGCSTEQINTYAFAAGASGSEVGRVHLYKIKTYGSLTKWR